MIDLEALDLEPRKLLIEVGKRLVSVAKRAYEWTPDAKLVQRNLELLAAIVAEEQLEVGHRRFFVKLCIRLLDQQRLGREKALDEDEMQALVHDEQALQLEEARPNEYGEFVGITFRNRKN